MTALEISSINASLPSEGSGHASRALRMMKVSDVFGSIGSLARSAVPVLENTKATSRKRLTVLSTESCIACDCVRPAEGMRMACIAMFFSSSVGMNSWPSRVKPNNAMANSTAAAAMTGNGEVMA